MNAHITANYPNWMTKHMAQNACDDRVFAAEPPEISGWLWGTRFLRQKVICLWRYRISEGLKKF
jgi:hypothetical protein